MIYVENGTYSLRVCKDLVVQLVGLVGDSSNPVDLLVQLLAHSHAQGLEPLSRIVNLVQIVLHLILKFIVRIRSVELETLPLLLADVDLRLRLDATPARAIDAVLVPTISRRPTQTLLSLPDVRRAPVALHSFLVVPLLYLCSIRSALPILVEVDDWTEDGTVELPELVGLVSCAS